MAWSVTFRDPTPEEIEESIRRQRREDILLWAVLFSVFVLPIVAFVVLIVLAAFGVIPTP